jgi:hypothetical protein
VRVDTVVWSLMLEVDLEEPQIATVMGPLKMGWTSSLAGDPPADSPESADERPRPGFKRCAWIWGGVPLGVEASLIRVGREPFPMPLVYSLGDSALV